MLKLLNLVNEMFSRPYLKGITYFGLVMTTWTQIRSLSASLNITGGWQRVVVELCISLVLSLGVFFLGVFFLKPLRWHFIYRSLKSEVTWFNEQNPCILVGVGPGGAIIAGMVAKLMAERDGKEPEIAVIDRKYNQNEHNEIQASVATAAKRLNLQPDDVPVNVIVVTSEIRTGGTICKVCEELRTRKIKAPVFAYLWSPGAKRKPKHDFDRYVLFTDQRGILPWPDVPARVWKP